MKAGDLVRLKQPFRPEPYCSEVPEEFNFAIIVGLTHAESAAGKPIIAGVVLQLIHPQPTVVYQDTLGTKAIFYFGLDEIEA